MLGNFFSKDERIAYLKKLKKNKKNVQGSFKLTIDNDTSSEDVFKIDPDYLVFNPMNGRIATSVLTYQNQFGKIDMENNSEHRKKIHEFIEKSSKENEKLKESLISHGQLTPGVVTLDGYVVGGNRRLFCTRLAGLRSYEAVILDQVVGDNPKELLILEKTLQHIVPGQEDYGAQEKYLETFQIVQSFGGRKGSNGKWDKATIDTAMIRKTLARYFEDCSTEDALIKKVIEYLERLETSEDYLKTVKNPKNYLSLGDKEDHLIGINKSLSKYQSGKEENADRVISKQDKLNFKRAVFAVTKAGYQGGRKGYRLLTTPKRKGKGNIFGTEGAWDIFLPIFEEHIAPKFDALSSFEDLKLNHADPQAAYDREEADFAKAVKPYLDQAFNQAGRYIDEQNLDNLAEEKIKQAFDALKKIEDENLDWPPKETTMDRDEFNNKVDELRQISDRLNRAIKKSK